MNHVCVHCGETYPGDRPNCPHCGADAELSWSDDSEAFDDPRMHAEEYDQFLEDEGLGEKARPRRSGCLSAFLILGLVLLPVLF